MKTKEIDINEIIPYVNNPRRNENAIDHVAASIKEFGWQQPIVVDKDLTIIVGHTRYQAAKRLKLKTVPIIIADKLTSSQVKAYRLADNRTGEFSEWDLELLKVELEGLIDVNFDLDAVGFKEDELDNLLSDISNSDFDEDADGVDGEDADDKINVGEEDEISDDLIIRKKVSFGEVWKLGNNILICGDSLAEKTRDFAINSLDVKIDMVFTDPPYGLGGYSGRKLSHKKVKGDDEAPGKFYSAFPLLKENYVWGNVANLHDVNFKPKEVIVWKKNHFGLGVGYKHQYEVCFYLGEFKGHDTNVWEIPRDTKYLHPTQKPIDLALRAIRNSEPVGVIDYFGGSGSTLLACEKASVPCAMIEFDNEYCGVIIARWEELTGKEAVLFSEVM